jgi:hypothetical protein
MQVVRGNAGGAPLDALPVAVVIITFVRSRDVIYRDVTPCSLVGGFSPGKSIDIYQTIWRHNREKNASGSVVGKVAGFIPDEVTGFFNFLILPASLWPCVRLSL